MNSRSSSRRVALLFLVTPPLAISCSSGDDGTQGGDGRSGDPVYAGGSTAGIGGMYATGGFPAGAGGFIGGVGGAFVGAGGDAFLSGGASFGSGGDALGAGGDPVGTGGEFGSGGSELGAGGNMSGSGGNGTGGALVASGGATAICSDELPTNTGWPEATCTMWADAGHCDAQWFIDQGACEQTCGRCSGGSGGAMGTGGTNDGTGGALVSSGGATSGCSDELPTGTGWPEATCAMWADAGECDAQWFIDQGACEQTCGRCSGGSGGAMGTGGANDGTGGTNDGTGGTTGEVTIPDLQGGSNGFASRYWDCCKPSCSWTANASEPVDSCDINDNNIGVNDGAANGCQPGGTAFTCHSWAPWAKSDALSYGFAAYNGAPCGTCFQVRFSGTSSNGQATPGIEGKQMIVQVTNIGGLASGQFDLLIPGGGVGDFDGCSGQWNVAPSSLGARYGGFRTTCGSNANCIRAMCEDAFGDSPDLMAGCDWYIDWFQMADNPDIRYQQIECPQEIRDRSSG